MLKKADLIVTGKIIDIKPDSNDKDLKIGEVEVYSILKGNYGSNRIKIKEERYIMGGYIERIPPVGTEIMLLQRVDDNNETQYVSNGNNIAIIENNQITKIYDGINVLRHNTIEKYNDYYQTHKDTAIVVNNNSYLIYMILIVVVIGMILLFYRIRKKKASGIWK